MFDTQKLYKSVEKVLRQLARLLCKFIEPTEEFSRRWLTAMLFCAFFISKDILYFGTVNDLLLKISQVLMIVCAFFAVVYIAVHRISLKNKSKFSLIWFCVLVVLCAAFNLDIRLGYIYFLVVLCVGSMLMWIAGTDRMFEFFYKAMTVISVVSVIAFGLQKVYPPFATLFPVVYNVTGLAFRFLVVTNLDDTYATFLRNWGPFREPGVFQAFVAFSLMYGMFRKKRVSLWSILFHILAIATTFSTTGYIVLMLIVGATIVQKKETMHNWALYKAILVIGCLGAFYLVFFTNVLFSSGDMSYASVFGKLFDGLSNTSMGSRMASIWVNIRMYLERPFFGGGMTFVASRFTELCDQLYGAPHFHNTNTIFIMLSTFGLPFMAMAVAKMWLFMNEYFIGGRWTKLLLLAAYWCSLFGENLMYSVIIMLPLFYVSKTERKMLAKLKTFVQEKTDVLLPNRNQEEE